MFRAVIFDLDGTLVESEQVNIEAGIKTFRDIGIQLTPEEVAKISGRSSLDLVPMFLDSRHLGAARDDAAAIEAYRQNYNDLWDSEVELMPGVRDVLRLLRDQNIPLAIATTNRRAIVDQFVKKFGFDDFFQHIVTSESVIQRKPHPEGYLLAAERIGVNKDEILVVEDSMTGLQAAKNAGLICAVIPNHHSRSHDFSSADYVFPSVTEILPLLILENS